MDVVILLAALGVITLGAEALVRGASAIALRAGLSPLFVGLTIVGFGTSTPELGASVAATLEGAVDVSLGNIVGSNIFNIGMILGVTALLCPIRVQLDAVRRDLLVAAGAACLPWTALAFGGVLPRGFGFALIGLLAGYLAFAFRAGRRASQAERELAAVEVEGALGLSPAARPFLSRTSVSVALVLAGLGCLVFGSHVFVDAALRLARAAGISELVLGLTVVAAGTSLPELITSLVAAKRGSPDIAIGNVIGSNIFNVLGILGVSTALRPQTASVALLAIDVPVMLVATLALLPILRSGGRISRTEGCLLLFGFFAYMASLLFRAGAS